MTLLLTAMNPLGIHQSSDYRLTDVAAKRAIEDIAGAKQLAAVLDNCVMSAPPGGLTLIASPDVPQVSRELRVNFLLRDFP